MSIDVRRVPIARIRIGKRLRDIDHDHAAFIGSSMAEEGQIQPIEIRPIKSQKHDYDLVVGGHRLVGAQQVGWIEIDAIVKELSADQARMREIDENVYRHDLSELDRAVFLAEKKRLYEKLHPETRHGGDRTSDQVAIFGDLVARFTDEVKDRLGYSERTIQRVVARAKITPDVRSKISGTWLARKGGELDALARLPPDEQQQAVDLLLDTAETRPKTVAAATLELRGQRPATVNPADAEFDRLMKDWRRASAPVRRRFLDHLASTGEFAPVTSERDAA